MLPDQKRIADNGGGISQVSRPALRRQQPGEERLLVQSQGYGPTGRANEVAAIGANLLIPSLSSVSAARSFPKSGGGGGGSRVTLPPTATAGL